MQIKLTDDVERFIQSLEKPAFAKTLRQITLLEEFGYTLGMPHSRQIQTNLYELRIRGITEIRVLYCSHNRYIVLLHGFVKKTQKTPQREIKKAVEIRKRITNA